MAIVIEAVTDSTYQDGIAVTRQAAIEAGVAEWTVDPQTGETEFTWKEER